MNETQPGFIRILNGINNTLSIANKALPIYKESMPLFKTIHSTYKNFKNNKENFKNILKFIKANNNIKNNIEKIEPKQINNTLNYNNLNNPKFFI